MLTPAPVYVHNTTHEKKFVAGLGTFSECAKTRAELLRGYRVGLLKRHPSRFINVAELLAIVDRELAGLEAAVE